MKISEICDINNQTISPTDDADEILYLDTSHMTNNVVQSFQKLKWSDAPSRARRKVKNNTIVYSTVRPNLHHHGILNDPLPNVVVSTGFVTLDVKPSMMGEVDAYYLYSLLSQESTTQHLQAIAENSVSSYPSISPSDIANLQFDFPTIQVQQRCANLLQNYEKKIALNRQTNRNLEALARQLYDYWFVQFDFPDENGKPYKSSGGKMVYNEQLKREIPCGWGVVSLAEYLQTYVNKVSAKEVTETDKYAPIEVLPRNRMSFSECAPLTNAVSGLCKFHKKHILLSNRRVYFHKVCIAAFDGITRDTVIVLEPTQDGTLGYSYQLVNSDAFISFATNHSYGSEQPVLSWEAAKRYKVVCPAHGEDKLYSKIVSPIIATVLKNELETASLIKQRDKLLPLLMNGQANVGPA